MSASNAVNINVVDVDNDELLDVEARIERRADYRAGYDAGLKDGAVRYFNSTVMENIAVELTLLRTTVDVLAKRERWYQAKLQDAYHVIGHPRPRS